jgi:hypothetical protein
MRERNNAAADNRKYLRMETFFEVRYSVIGDPAPASQAHFKDLARDGFQLLSREPLGVGSHIQVEMRIPGDSALMSAQGEVVWVSGAARDWHASGVKITRINPEDRAKLLEYVCDEWLKKRRAEKAP